MISVAISNRASRLLPLVEVFAFAGFIAWFIWQLQDSFRYAWLVFPVWLIASFLLNSDTPQTLGWRVDNLGSSTKRASMVFVPCALIIAVVGPLVGGEHHTLLHVLLPAATSRLEFACCESPARCDGQSHARFLHRRPFIRLAPLAESRACSPYFCWRSFDGLAVREGAQHFFAYGVADDSGLAH